MSDPTPARQTDRPKPPPASWWRRQLPYRGWHWAVVLPLMAAICVVSYLTWREMLEASRLPDTAPGTPPSAGAGLTSATQPTPRSVVFDDYDADPNATQPADGIHHEPLTPSDTDGGGLAPGLDRSAAALPPDASVGGIAPPPGSRPGHGWQREESGWVETVRLYYAAPEQDAAALENHYDSAADAAGMNPLDADWVGTDDGWRRRYGTADARDTVTVRLIRRDAALAALVLHRRLANPAPGSPRPPAPSPSPHDAAGPRRP